MIPTTLYKYHCWDTARVPEVINKEAVSVDIPTFLATHTPFQKITYLKTPSQLDSTSEDDLLTELQRRGQSNQHTFAVIQGIPGSGKSHLIRWLKERYAANNAQSGEKDVVLLIEKANNTLRQTLQQILDSEAFDVQAFSAHRDKLQRSTSQLSEHGLEETLINNLQVAYQEDKRKGQPALKPNLERHLNDFLLDSTVRSELRQANGPIKRIARFLAASNIRDTGDTLPEFLPSDFEYKAQFLQALRQQGARPDTTDLVSKLSKDQSRTELAQYLNSLLEFAIGRTTALSSEDLKQMFNALRRELRRQNRSLALFIEDITAFTGLDTGLIDILITQHTGEGNRSFCRILSVIGVTDYYYRERFPENVRDRISHHLTLNQTRHDIQSSTAAELLSSREVAADIAGRYLNAIRMSGDRLERWYVDGADPADLPNACQECPLRVSCHAAFGSISLTHASDKTSEIGLYPFNATALWAMYEHINTNVASRTPRTLLNAIVSYVLLSHTNLIDQGRFPPPRLQVGSEFSAPSLRKPQQRNLFSAYGLSADVSDRMESLIVFWGDRTLDATEVDGKLLLGTIPQELFDAFGLPFIAGQPVVPPIVEPALPQPKPPVPPTVVPPTRTESPQEDPIIRDIEDWRAGKPLQNYNVLGQALARFIRDAIDWDAYDVSGSLIEERIRQTRFTIQGQAGRSNPRYTLPLARTDSLINAFYAVHALIGDTSKLTDEQLTIHLTALSVWLAEHESEIIAFVQAAQHEANDVPSLLTVQTQATVALAVLAGELNSESVQSAEQLARRLIRFCAAFDKWEGAVSKVRSERTDGWERLMRNSQIAGNVSKLQSELLDTLNCPQGRSKNVIFVDMASLLDVLQQFRKSGWFFPPINVAGEGEVWQKPIIVHTVLSANFANVLEEERNQLISFLSRLDKMTTGVTGRELDTHIKRFLTSLADANQQAPRGITEESKPAFSTMEQTVTVIRNLIAEQNLANFAPAVSGAVAYVERTRGYVDYLEALHKYAQERLIDWEQRLADFGELRTQVEQIRTTIENLYTASAAQVDKFISTQGENA
jgi:hypothetical protein